MPRTSHDPESLVKLIGAELSKRAGHQLSVEFAFAAGARISHLLGHEVLTEWEVAEFLTNPLDLYQELTPERISERSKNIATLAWSRIQDREEVA